MNKERLEGLGISGHIKVFITRINGYKELVFEDHNAIQGDYADIIVDALNDAEPPVILYGMDNLFSGNANPPDEDEDGIAIKDGGGLWYEMIMAANVQSAGEILFVGTFTGVGITVADANSVKLGHKWENAIPDFTSVGDAYGCFAKPSSWTSQAVLAAETLTIEWLIKHQAT